MSSRSRPMPKSTSKSHLSRESGHEHKKKGRSGESHDGVTSKTGNTKNETKPPAPSTQPAVKVIVTGPQEPEVNEVSRDTPGQTSADINKDERRQNGDQRTTEVDMGQESRTGGSHPRQSNKTHYDNSSTSPRQRIKPIPISEFNVRMNSFLEELDNPKFHKVDETYPIEELTSVVKSITDSVSGYRSQALDTQNQMEELRELMKNIRENLHFSVTRQAMDLRGDEDSQSQEEKELQAKLTRLNADIAEANAFLSEALRLAADTEGSAVRANIAAEQAKAETERVEREIETRRLGEEKRKREEKRKMEEQKRQKEEQERKAQEEKRRKAEEWAAKESAAHERSSNVYDKWPAATYERVDDNGESEVTCIARGQPGAFDKNHVTCTVAKDRESEVTYLPNEELISNVIELKSNNEEEQLKSPIFVAIPHVLSRSSGHSREPVVKAMMEGQWRDLPTKDVTFDSHKDTKFAQAEICHLTTLIVMSRLKHDYVTLSPTKSHKVTSSFDHRVTLSVEKNTFNDKEHFLLQVQPVDNNSINEFRSREPNGKGLLNSSHIVHMAWESKVFNEPIKVTLSCPPNPAIAKKMALARKMKEDKMKNPIKNQVMTMGDIEKEKEKQKKRMQDYAEAEGEKKTVAKWYMGEYANNDDDERDTLHFLQYSGGKWSLEPDMDIQQVKVDVITFDLEHPIEKMMVLRTRPNTSEDTVLAIAASFNEFLTKRFVEAVVRQRRDDPFEVCLQVTPISRIDAVVSQLADSGFVSGPAPSHVISLYEGDIIELGFSGNIECKQELPAFLIYKSNVPTVTYFRVKEENRYRQKDHDVFSGLLILTRRFINKNSKKKRDDGAEDDVRREKMCALQINIPKHHIEPTTEPIRAPLPLPTNGPLDPSLLQTLSEELGDEWKLVAHFLGLHRARVQAIIRNQTVAEKSESDAKYEMLVTWLKRASRATDKVSALSNALRNSERPDLAETVLAKSREFTHTKGQTTYVN